MTAHYFNQSKKYEEYTANLHDSVYNSLRYKDLSLININRKACDYADDEGRLYQQNDTDLLLEFQNGQGLIKKVAVSEKTRKKYFGDVYLEIISIMSHSNNPQQPDYIVHTPGWAVKGVKQYSPRALSVVFEEKETYTSVFIADYDKLKEKIFTEELMKVLNSHSFLLLINTIIAQKERYTTDIKGFQYPLSARTQDKKLKYLYDKFKVMAIVGAKNGHGMGAYYTIGLTFSEQYVKSLSHFRKVIMKRK